MAVDSAYATWQRGCCEADLRDAIGSRQWYWGYTESLREATWLSTPSAGDLGLADLDEGRVFNDECELRWERDGEAFHTLLIADGEAPATVGAAPTVLLERSDLDQNLLLWGTRPNGHATWREGRIPGDLVYPFEESHRVAVRCRTYRVVGGACAVSGDCLAADCGDSTVYRFSAIVNVGAPPKDGDAGEAAQEGDGT